MKLYLNNSYGQKSFKKHLGNANHLIITTLVGLNAIETGGISDAPPEMRAAWNPQDSKISARRARRLVLDTALVRSVDALDIYIRSANKAPRLIQNALLQNKIDKAGRSIFKKVVALKDHFGDRDQLLFDMAIVMIAWRNRSAHAESDIEISEETRLCIQNNSSRLHDDFSGLSAVEFLAGFDRSEPRLKEVTSLIRATHSLVLLLESSLFKTLNPEQYLKDLIWHEQHGAVAKTTSKKKKLLIQSVWGKDPSERQQTVLRRLRQQGLSSELKTNSKKSSNSFILFEDELIDKVCTMTPSNVFDWIKPDTNAIDN